MEKTTLREFRVYKGKKGLRQVSSIWHELIELLHKPRFFHYYEWHESYVETLVSNPDLLVFCIVFNKDRPEALLPLTKVRRVHAGVVFDVLELPYHSHLALNDIVFPECYQSKESVDFLLYSLRNCRELQWDYLNFSKLLPDSCALKSFANSSVLCKVESINTCDYFNITSYEDIFNNLSKNMKSALKRARRKSQKAGVVKNITYHSFPYLMKAFKIFQDIEASGWKGENGTKTAIKCDPNLVSFYQSLIQRFGKLGKCKIDILELDSKPIACQFCLLIDDTAYLLKIGYNEEMSYLSPGTLHMEYLLKQYDSDASIKYCNLVSGKTASWHKRWKTYSYLTNQIRIANLTPKGVLFLLLLHIKKKLGVFFDKNNYN